MSKVNTLLKFYTDVLASVKVKDVEDGLLSLTYGSGDEVVNEPCMNNGLRLCLPTEARLKSGNWDGLMAFHPLSEDLLRGESDVLKFLMLTTRFNLQMVIAELMSELMSIAVNTEIHETLSQRQAKFLMSMGDVNHKTEAALQKVLKHHHHQLISIHLKRDYKLDGVSYRRAAVVSFPILDELKSEGTKIYDVNVGSAKNKRNILALFEFIFEGALPKEGGLWAFPTNSSTAPYFVALMKAFSTVGGHLNSLVHLYRKFLDDPQTLKADYSWAESLDHLEQWSSAIPVLPGNEGAMKKGETSTPAQASQAKASTSSDKKVSWRDAVSSVANQNRLPQEQSTVITPQPAYAAQPAPQRPAVQSTPDGKVSWNSVRPNQPYPSTTPPAPPAHAVMPMHNPFKPNNGYAQPGQHGQPQYGQPQYGQPQYGQPQHTPAPAYGQPYYGPQGSSV